MRNRYSHPDLTQGDILAAMCATEDGDTLLFDDAAGKQVGWVQFINGNDGCLSRQDCPINGSLRRPCPWCCIS